ncbi:hypothetical protein FY528_10860 [Hymenobacter lutimineralis]|uniref:Uncharacterized protein n=1 Tax=Hymenobacter lutimineralis TaxID=2606448 RepID=A0A5D6V191_9BACT|nr:MULTISPECIES: hypothetical protein [Hymenobacter]QIX61698.1 hypothetical protein HER32_11110 [Hymenobacter sp. BT18]TYZ09240.1 hypothetical protein FY528_10860 [Hymenobacter lutimineralis]
MKTLLSTPSRVLLLGALAALGFSSAAQAQVVAASAPTYVSKLDENVYLLRISNPAQQKGRVQIVRMRDGARLSVGRSSEASFGYKLNVQNLVGEQYEVLVSLGANTYRYPLNLSPSAYQAVVPANATAQVRR